MHHIAILTHQFEDFQQSTYLLRHICGKWEQQGIRISIHKGVEHPLPHCDLLILHIDLSVIPQAYIDAINMQSNVINGNVDNIEKRTFSQLIVNERQQHTGPVIVKTNANCGGLPEQHISQMFTGETTRLGVQRPLRKAKWLIEYPIYQSTKEVPPGVWKNEHLIVEKLISERDGEGNYCIRCWIFFGDQEINYICHSPDAIVKSQRIVRREFVDEIPNELREIRKQKGIDFGKFDYGIVDGEVVLYDINKTPGFPRDPSQLKHADESLETLSNGLTYFLNRT